MRLVPPLAYPDAADPTRYVNGNSATLTRGSWISSEFFNAVLAELIHCITASGQTPDAGNQTQLWAAMQAAAVAAVSPAGTVSFFAGPVAPAGWLECNGAAVSRATYASLFAVIQTTHGAGDGTTTFNLPDGRGEMLRGWDHGRGIDAGRVLGSWQDWATAAPKTTTPQQLHADGSSGPLVGGAANPSVAGFVRPAQVGENVTDGKANDYDANQIDVLNAVTGDAETRPRNIAMMMIIKF